MGIPPARTARRIAGNFRTSPPMAYRTSTAANPPNRVIPVLIMRSFRTVKTDGFGTRFGRFAPRCDGQFEMAGMFRYFRRQVHADLNESAMARFDRDFTEVSQIERARRYAACTDLIGLILCRLVGDADLVAIADVAIRQHHIQRLANLVDGAVVAATGGDAIGEITAHQDQRCAIANGFQALPVGSGGSRHRCRQVLFRVVADQALWKAKRIHDGVARVETECTRDAFVLESVADS